MNREYKFRGKPVEDVNFTEINVHIGKDDFVYGSLIWNDGNPYIVGNVVEATDEYISLEQWISVRPETVGQYTGLKDKNGVEIYEGDLLAPLKAEVVWNEILLCWSFRHQNDTWKTPLFHDTENYMKLEVIGNIHENGDLL
ncbi:MAG: YopX family protein [Acholeplasmataceae bacterium]